MGKYSSYDKYVNFINRYKKAVNASSGSEVDSNANVENKNITTLQGELNKKDIIGTNRLLMVNKLTEMFGEEMADEYIRQLNEHEIYKHDETSIMPYCVSITMYPFLFEGLKSIGGLSDPPKNLDSFCGAFVNLVFAIASQFAGAVSTPEFLTYLDYFIRQEYGDDYYLHPETVVTMGKRPKSIDRIITDKFSQVVYSLNQPAAARNFQSVFWNIAYFDKNYFNGIFHEFIFPDDTEPQWESVSWLQKRFMKWFNAERLRKPLTFPVETMNLLDNGKEYVDQEWFDFTAKMYSEGHSFFTYRSNSVDSLASCCFAGEQMTLTRSSVDDVRLMCFKDLYETLARENNATTEVFHDGNWAMGKIVRLPARDMYTVTTANNKTLYVTDNHIHPTADGNKTTTELTVNDYMLFSDAALEQPIDKDYNNGLCVTKSGHTYFKIDSIERVQYNDEYVYCFEMHNQNEPYFTLPNGIITHNCRLRNELQDNTFSFTLGAGGVSTGSKGVITMNVNRFVQNAVKNHIDISDAIAEQVRKIHCYLKAFNAIMQENFESKLLPVYDAGYISLDKQFLTVGINGFVEGAEFLGIQISPNKDYFEYGEKILKPIYELNKAERTNELMFNTEFVPKYCGHKVA